MLERVKPGDLVILSNGEQARVTSVYIKPEGTYILYFNKPVYGIKGVSRYNNWEYNQNGVLEGSPAGEDINIVKIIAE